MKCRNMTVLAMFCSLPEKNKTFRMFVCKVTANSSADAVAMNKEFLKSDGKAEIKHRKALRFYRYPGQIDRTVAVTRYLYFYSRPFRDRVKSIKWFCFEDTWSARTCSVCDRVAPDASDRTSTKETCGRLQVTS